MLCRQEGRIGHLKTKERDGYGNRRPQRRQLGREPEYQRALERKIENYEHATGEKRDSEETKYDRLQPVTTGAHIGPKIDVRPLSASDALRCIEQDSFIIRRHHAVCVEQEQHRRHDQKDRGRNSGPRRHHPIHR